MEQRDGSLYAFFRELPALLVSAVVIAFLLKMFVVQPFWIPTPSMEPTLKVGDRFLALKFVYRFSDPKPGDIVVFVPPNEKSLDYVKRVVAVGGQRVKIVDGVVFVDGKALAEPYLAPESSDSGSMEEVAVPRGTVFVMGDNRPNSLDSRVFGPVDSSTIIGKAVFIYWPLSRIGFLGD